MVALAAAKVVRGCGLVACAVGGHVRGVTGDEVQPRAFQQQYSVVGRAHPRLELVDVQPHSP